MTDEAELNELRERIGRLSSRVQARLLELVLVDNRRRWSEAQAENLRAERELLDAEARAELAALEVWHLQRQRSSAGAEGAKREAG